MSIHKGIDKGRAMTGKALRGVILVAALVFAVLTAGCLADADRDDVPGGGGGGNGGGNGGGGNCVAGAVNFSEVETALTAATCYDCHNPGPTTVNCDDCHFGQGRTPSDITPITHAGMVNVTSTSGTSGEFVVDPGSSDTSVLWWVISGDAQYASNGGVMLSSMPVSNLTSTEKDDIQCWIEDGAPE